MGASLFDQWPARIWICTLISLCWSTTVSAQSAPEIESLDARAALALRQGRLDEAETLGKDAVALAEKTFGADQLPVAGAVRSLAQLYHAMRRYEEAGALYKRALALTEKARGSDHPDVATALDAMAAVYLDEGPSGQDAAAVEPLLRRALAIRMKAFGPDNAEVATSLSRLAGMYWSRRRYAEAEPLARQALAMQEKARSPDDPVVVGSLSFLAQVVLFEGRADEAASLFRRLLELREKILPPDRREIVTTMETLALLETRLGHTDKATRLEERILAFYVAALQNSERTLQPGDPAIAAAMTKLAQQYVRRQRYDEAETLYRRALAIYDAIRSPYIDDVLHSLALMCVDLRKWRCATDAWRRYIATSQSLLKRAGGGGQAPLTKVTRGVDNTSRGYFGFFKVASRVAEESPAERAGLAGETFLTAQWMHATEAAVSLAQMAARAVKGDASLAELVRERQDLTAEWQRRDAQSTAALSLPPEQRNAAAGAENGARIATIEKSIASIDQRLHTEFPEYAALADPGAVSIPQVQADLRADEALVLFLPTSAFKALPEETFVWVVTRTDFRWVRSKIGTASLAREVTTLRCGLDASAWEGKGWDTCVKTAPAKRISARTTKGLPYDLKRANALYQALFGEVEGLVNGKHLLIVASGALSQLPLQALVAREPAEAFPDDYRNAHWLIRDHAITILPSVASLKALRELAKPSRAVRPMIGFGNPLLEGSGTFDAERAARARANTSCPVDVASQAVAGRSLIPLAFRGGHADVAQLRAAAPLPETADELCAVATGLKAASSDIFLGARATVPEIERLSAAGELAKYRLVHFATHGVLSGQVMGNAEPGLILTPPTNASDADDGYLSASRIATLKLDADWVILSACNTAAGDGKDTEALSGLARAFFYAGARSLLVSHWAVNSDATVKLITTALNAMAADTTIGRAEALRRAELALMADPTRPWAAHPAYWAPFVVVGEGGAAK